MEYIKHPVEHVEINQVSESNSELKSIPSTIKKVKTLIFFIGSTVSKLFSLLSFGISVAMIVHCGNIAFSSISAIITQDFDSSVLLLPSLALRLFILTVPFCCWPAGKSLQLHFRNWHEFQVNNTSIISIFLVTGGLLIIISIICK